MSNARHRGKKQRARLEVSSRKWETPKGTFYARMGMIKDRNCKDLTEAKEITKRWQKYTEELHQKRS